MVLNVILRGRGGKRVACKIRVEVYPQLVKELFFPQNITGL